MVSLLIVLLRVSFTALWMVAQKQPSNQRSYRSITSIIMHQLLSALWNNHNSQRNRWFLPHYKRKELRKREAEGLVKNYAKKKPLSMVSQLRLWSGECSCIIILLIFARSTVHVGDMGELLHITCHYHEGILGHTKMTSPQTQMSSKHGTQLPRV